MAYIRKKRLDLDEYAEGVLKGDRVILSRAITLVESNLPEDNELADELLEKIMPHTGKSIRIGITGIPGVGKSTFIESFGKVITDKGHNLAVLTVDPSSQMSKGSILGDKTRMVNLSANEKAYIRPSASGSSLGGVHHKTRETILLAEAAGFDIVLVETVGVGQSETAVYDMTDFFLLLMIAGAGDELQGIKKGIMEMADCLAITKADGDNVTNCERARREYANAMHLFPIRDSGLTPSVLTCSALKKEGLSNIWDEILHFHDETQANGFYGRKRKHQNVQWMHDIITNNLKMRFYNNSETKYKLEDLEFEVSSGKVPAPTAARKLLGNHSDRLVI